MLPGLEIWFGCLVYPASRAVVKPDTPQIQVWASARNARNPHTSSVHDGNGNSAVGVSTAGGSASRGVGNAVVQPPLWRASSAELYDEDDGYGHAGRATKRRQHGSFIG